MAPLQYVSLVPEAASTNFKMRLVPDSFSFLTSECISKSEQQTTEDHDKSRIWRL